MSAAVVTTPPGTVIRKGRHWCRRHAKFWYPSEAAAETARAEGERQGTHTTGMHAFWCEKSRGWHLGHPGPMHLAPLSDAYASNGVQPEPAAVVEPDADDKAWTLADVLGECVPWRALTALAYAAAVWLVVSAVGDLFGMARWLYLWAFVMTPVQPLVERAL
jgi:hypothetical protein